MGVAGLKWEQVGDENLAIVYYVLTFFVELSVVSHKLSVLRLCILEACTGLMP